jgi:hypothetical protein
VLQWLSTHRSTLNVTAVNDDGETARQAAEQYEGLDLYDKISPQIMSSAPPHPFSVLTNTTTVTLDRYRDVVLGLKSVLHGVGPENFGWMVGRLPWARCDVWA